MFHIYEGRLRECKWASSSPRNLFLTGAGESKFAAHGTEETAHEICNSNAGSVCFFTLGLWFFLKKIRAKKPGCSFFCSISRTVSTPNSSVAHLQDLLKTKKEKKSRNFLKKKTETECLSSVLYVPFARLRHGVSCSVYVEYVFNNCSKAKSDN